MAQLDLFSRMRSAPPVAQEPDLEKIRMILRAALQELRAAEEMPWRPAHLRSWRHVFQNMTKWLPSEERNKFCQSFDDEILRLQESLTIFEAE